MSPKPNRFIAMTNGVAVGKDKHLFAVVLALSMSSSTPVKGY